MKKIFFCFVLILSVFNWNIHCFSAQKSFISTSKFISNFKDYGQKLGWEVVLEPEAPLKDGTPRRFCTIYRSGSNRSQKLGFVELLGEKNNVFQLYLDFFVPNNMINSVDTVGIIFSFLYSIDTIFEAERDNLIHWVTNNTETRKQESERQVGTYYIVQNLWMEGGHAFHPSISFTVKKK